MHCSSVVCARRPDLLVEGVVSVECTETSRFLPHSDDSLWQAANELAAIKARGGTCKEFDLEHKLQGLTYKPHGALWDKALQAYVQPVSHTCL